MTSLCRQLCEVMPSVHAGCRSQMFFAPVRGLTWGAFRHDRPSDGVPQPGSAA